jgi:enediyne polyketide synthase
VVLHGRERSRDGDSYVWDVDVRDASGRLVERWTGLTLRAVRKQDGSGPWTPTLLGPYLERRTEQVLPAVLRVAVRPDAPGEDGGVQTRRRQTAQTVGWLLGGEAELRYRPDGKPTASGGFAVSSAHGAGVTVSVAATDVAVACDVEPVVERTHAEWADLLGPAGQDLVRLIMAESGQPLGPAPTADTALTADTAAAVATAATRVWGALEALAKTGRARADVVLDGAVRDGAVRDGGVRDGAVRDDGWVLLRSGRARIATFATALRDRSEPVVLTLLAEVEE